MDVVFGHLRWGLVIEYGAVDYEADAEEVIHLEEQSKCALLPLEVYGIELDQLVESMERIVDEEEPVQEVVRANVGGIGKLFLVPDDITFKHGSVACETTSQDYWQELVSQEAAVVATRLHP